MESISFASAILTALPYFMELEVDYLRAIDRNMFEEENFQKENYDFIIVGGGTAGCVLANRLSEHFSVLLLEAGGDPPAVASVPGFDATSPSIRYLYKRIPQPSAQSLVTDKIVGKMLGGSGSHNGLIYNRGHPKGYDSWAEATGDRSWKHDSLLKYFKKLENYMGSWPATHEHGRHGPFVVETNMNLLDPIAKKAAMELGYKYSDPNGPQIPGFSPTECMRKNGRRVSTYTAYLQPILNRKNLQVNRYSEVERLLISKKIVKGVQYLRHGRRLKAYASKEVILCAGVFGTPFILWKSGIGPKKMLKKAGIKPILDLPAVGKYYQDHVGVTGTPWFINPSYLTLLQHNLTEVEFEKFLNHENDNILSIKIDSPQAFIVSPVAQARNEKNWPDIHILRGDCPGLPTNQVCFDIVVVRPTISRKFYGTLKLNTSAYLAGERDNVKLALLNDKVLKSSTDRKVIRQGMKLLSKIAKTEAFKKIGVRETVDSTCVATHKVNSIAYWNCYFPPRTFTHYHPVGTCRMGKMGDLKNSVVDSTLRVHGIMNLRIVDGSIMPYNTNANTNTPVIAIAEKVADQIFYTFSITDH